MWSEGAIVEEHITGFEVDDGVLYASTQSDLFRYSLSGDSWEALGLKEHTYGRGVRAFVILDGNEILAGGGYGDPHPDLAPLYRSSDGGETWQPKVEGFGDEDGEHAGLWSVDRIHSSDILFANAGGVVKSVDAGESWDIVYGKWDTPPAWPGFLHIDQQNPEIVWRGSASPIFEPWLLKTEDGGESWDRFRPFEGGEGLPTDILIHPENSDHVLLAGIHTFTTDGGETWDTYSPGRVGLYAITGSARHPETAFASGVNQERSLFFARTTDFGGSWEIVEHEEGPTDIRVEEMVATVHEGREILFLGTNKGVYSYTFEE